MRQFNLKHTFPRRRTGTENIENKAGPIHNLAAKGLFKIPLLARREARINDDNINLIELYRLGKLLHLAASEERCRASGPQQDCGLTDNDKSDGGSKTNRLFQSGIGSPDVFLWPCLFPWKNDSSTGGRLLGIKSAQSSFSVKRGSAPTGMIVLMACL